MAMELNELVPPLKRSTLGGDVHAQLRELLMSGSLMPGEQLSLRTMAAALGVSVMPVREAVSRLVAEQAFEVAPNKTVRVPSMTVAQFREITEIRVMLEGLSTARAALRRSNVELDAIVGLHRDFEAESALPSPDTQRLVLLNKQLHFAIYRAAAMPALQQIIENLWLRIGPILNYDLRSRSAHVGRRTAVNHHGKLIAALKKRDPVKAELALRDDLESAAAIIIGEGRLLRGPDAPARDAHPRPVRIRAAQV